MRCTLTGISLYPIKALGKIDLPQSDVTDLGLAGDRRWVLADTDGQFITQRSHPQLAQIQVAQIQVVQTRGNQSGELLQVSAPGSGSLDLSPPANGARGAVTVWKDTVSGAQGSSLANDWFSNFLGQDCRVFFMDGACVRPVAMPEGQPGQHQVSFADGFPCLLASTASLDLLNSKLAQPVNMDRFRPNLVVTGCQPHAEDGWNRFRIGGAVFRAIKPCSRCKVPTVDQETGLIPDPGEPVRTLATYRTQPGGIMFGVNLVVEEEGVIALGDEVQFLSA